MRLFLMLVVSVMMGGSLFAQAPDTIWTRLYGDKPGWDGYDQLYGATPTFDGGFAMNGYSTTDADTIQGDQWVVKINASGDTLWTNTFGNFNRRDYGRDIIETYDSCLVILGHGRIADDVENYRIRLFKADSLGNTIWDKNYVSIDGYSTESIIETNDSGFAIVGWTDARDVFLFRADSLGDSLWSKTYGGSNNDIGYDVCQTDDGGFIIVGATESFGMGSYDMYIIKTDQNGDTLWTQTYGEVSFDEARAVTRTNDGDYLVAGYILNTSYDVFLIKIQSDGDTLWTNSPSQADGNDVAYGISRTSDNGFLIAGKNYNLVDSKNNMYIMKVDLNGDSVWSYTCMSSTADEAHVAYEGVSGEVYLFGTRAPSSSGSYRDYWVFAFANPLDVDEEHVALLPTTVSISDNYPNPFNPSTTIDYNIPKRSHVTIEIFNILGRKVKTIVNEAKSAGSHTIRWDGTDAHGSSVSTGIYLYRFQAGEFVQTKKMLLLK
jgi:hypothetical protein